MIWDIVIGPLYSKSSELGTFNTPFWIYKLNRLPFGICVASDATQTMVEKSFGDIIGVIAIHDDLIIASKTSDELDESNWSFWKSTRTKYPIQQK